MHPMEQFEVKPIFGDHPLFSIGGHGIYFTNQALFMWIVVAFSILFLTVTVKKNRLVPSRWQSMAEISYDFVRGMIHSTMGKDGLVFFPFIFALFMFVLCSNFFGLIPYSFSITAQIAVTFALTFVVMAMTVIVGLMKHGLGFLKLFVPKAPLPLQILLTPIEFISFATRLVSLSVRLFANMMAGHTMLQVFAAFVVSLGIAGGVLSALSIAPFAMILFIFALELLVAFLQAYVFAILSCIYLNEALHLHGSH